MIHTLLESRPFSQSFSPRCRTDCTDNRKSRDYGKVSFHIWFLVREYFKLIPSIIFDNTTKWFQPYSQMPLRNVLIRTLYCIHYNVIHGTVKLTFLNGIWRNNLYSRKWTDCSWLQTCLFTWWLFNENNAMKYTISIFNLFYSD